MGDTVSKAVTRTAGLAIVITILRLGLVVFQSPFMSMQYASGITFSLIETFWVFIVPIGFVCTSSRLARIGGMTVSSLLVFWYISAIHYELLFGRLPSFSVLYYLNDIDHLKVSILHNLPIWKLCLELLFIIAGVLLLLRIRVFTCRISMVILGLGIVFQLLLVSFRDRLPESVLWGSRTPLAWGIQSARSFAADTGWEKGIQSDDVKRFQSFTGHLVPSGGRDLRYPLCDNQFVHSTARKANGRSVIVLILESVGSNEMQWHIGKEPVMPHLSQFARKNMHFRNFFAPGIKSCQLFPSLFGGQQVQTFQNILWQMPLPRIESFVEKVRRAGYETSYFHGGDLAFEQQRPFLRSAGFEHISEFQLEAGIEKYGWGWDDRVVFKQMTKWIEQQTKPFLSTLFSLSTHDPYVLPSDWKTVWRSEDQANTDIAMLNAYSFLDEQLKEFFEWYEMEQRHKGTILVIIGDHTPHYSRAVSATGVARYRVPLIVAGSDIPIANADELLARNAGAHDLSATILSLLDMPPLPCGQGLDLFSSSWPTNRWLFSTGGDSLEQIVLWNNSGQMVYDLLSHQLRVIDYEVGLKTALESDNRRVGLAAAFLDLLIPINMFFLKNSAYAPPVSNVSSEVLPDVSTPIIVSHRGNISLESGRPFENSVDAIFRAIHAGFEWVELDFHMTADKEVVAFHDSYVQVGVEKKAVSSLTRAELSSVVGGDNVATLDDILLNFGNQVNLLLELKIPSNDFYIKSEFAYFVVKKLKQYPLAKMVIVDSFSRSLVSSVSSNGGVTVGFDIPFKQPLTQQRIEIAKQNSFDWIYAHYSVITPDAIRMAHQQGIRIMAYTVNDRNIVFGWGDCLPDGIITDQLDIAEMFE